MVQLLVEEDRVSNCRDGDVKSERKIGTGFWRFSWERRVVWESNVREVS